MISWLSVNALLKAVIAILAAAVVITLTLGAWESWGRLAAANRIAAVSNVSAHLFTALHNLRVDRASTFRDLSADKALTSVKPLVREVRAAEMPALRSALIAIMAVDFPEREASVARLGELVDRMATLQEESNAAFLQPKAARRPGIAEDYFKESSALLELLQQLSSRLTLLVKLKDPLIDQLMALKQIAWVGRNAGGDASLLVSNALGGLPVPPDALAKYAVHMSKAEAAWVLLEDLAAGLPLPTRFTDAVERSKREFFTADAVALRLNLLKAVIAGERPAMTVDQYTPSVVAKLATLIAVAETALDVAKEHAARQLAAATWELGVQLILLIAAAVLAAGMMWVVSRRVSGPLRTIQQAMLKVAGGDYHTEVLFAGRKDEIGGLAGALEVFRDSMAEAERLRVEQREAETRAGALRKAEMARLADEFQGAVGGIVDAVSTASSGLEAAAGTLTRTAETTLQLAGVVASASEEASANVQSVASATEEMTGSVNEIARQVQESSRIAGEAVDQAGRTDARIAELSNAASRIGDVVKLITAIAEQTNLLALNATIEAARAGDAGRGFAVVAQEVKALAAQTAKATDEIGTQITSMQTATQDSVAAIKEIGGTIGRIAEIASAIAAAVEEQGATTQEIARNVHQAAQGSAQVATNITDVNRGAAETGSASSQVLGSAQSLARESSHLRAEVEKFVGMVRAA
jgi:methyl-accepting chemotaxis protein